MSLNQKYENYIRDRSLGGLVGFGGGHRKKGGHVKKIREKGGSPKILPLLEGCRGKKFSYWGGHATF